MATAKHTPGPWSIKPVKLETLDFAISENGVMTDYDIYTMDGEFITTIQHPFNGKRTKANAHLMGAAPDLLEALQEVTLILDAVLGVSGGYPRDADGPAIKARAAIAKATGESA